MWDEMRGCGIGCDVQILWIVIEGILRKVKRSVRMGNRDELRNGLRDGLGWMGMDWVGWMLRRGGVMMLRKRR